MNLSVVVLAYNESQNLENVIYEIDSALEGSTINYEILIVDDGSQDRTGEIADEIARLKNDIRVIHHQTNRGLGGGYRTGFSYSFGDYITFFPADGQFPASIILQFYPYLDRADMVLGYVPNRKSSFLAKSLSVLEKLLYHILFGQLPRFQGILIFHRTLLDEFELKSTGRGWAILMELIIRTVRAGYRVMSVPTEMRPRMSGKSKVNNPSTILDNLKQAFILRHLL